jgi:RNA polymerase-binding transcription factor DksA
MTDTADRALEREEEFNDDALDEHYRHDPAHDKNVCDSAEVCVGCNCAIPLERRIAVPGVELCRECKDEANWLEAAARRNGRRNP